MKRPLPRTRASSSTRGSCLLRAGLVMGDPKNMACGGSFIADRSGPDRGLRPLQGCGTQALPVSGGSFSEDEMSKVRTIDTHTHILTQETAALLRKAAPKVPVTITPDDAESALLDVGGVLYRPFPTGGFDIARRLRDMDAAGVDVQVLSATPQTYLYNQDAALTAVTAAIQNDQMAKHIAAHPA